MNSESTLLRTRKTLKTLAIVFAVVIGIYYGVQYLIQVVQNLTNPPQIAQVSSIYLPVDQKFENLVFPITTPLFFLSEKSNPRFTVQGEFSEFPKRVFVYKLKQSERTFQTAQNARDIAKSFEFEAEKSTISQILWRDVQGRTLSFDFETFAWQLTTNKSGASNTQKNIKPSDIIVFASNLLNTEYQDVNFNQFRYSTVPDSTTYNTSVDTTEINTNTGYIQTKFDTYIYAAALNSEPSDQSEKKFVTQVPLRTQAPYRSDLELEILIDSNNRNLTHQNLKSLLYTPTFIDPIEPGIYDIVSAQEAVTKLQNGKSIWVHSLKSDGSSPTKDLDIVDFVVDASQIELIYAISEDRVGYTHPTYAIKAQAVSTEKEIFDVVFYVDAIKTE